MAAPSLGLATAVLAFLGFAFSGVEGSSAGGFDLNFQVGRLQVPYCCWPTLTPCIPTPCARASRCWSHLLHLRDHTAPR